ncbi:sigma-70 family RNA polymerase sigma factor [Streptomyces sp. DSM 42041]|uniref:Sigma-70 family RNA polymerase sigma factor n=1 Tax=Streptomyces hazeniae TaxID=3075538 RepID=A0ABU2NL30_9ACTN|nr:sigma-70 family RNA polymerase sigma factor [Streptomyces sp. DSM 42041]MDT0377316.1 sigma-70 family RNA polymerase sigma factor [Streptomyces sp. DSM 42041]
MKASRRTTSRRKAGEEPELVARARRRDPEAFAALFNETRGEVQRYITHRVRDPHLAEDLTSEVYAKAWRNVHTFTWQGTPFIGWLITIARTLVADHYKAARTRREVLEFTPGETFAEDCTPVGAITTSTEGAVLAAITREQVHTALAALSEDHRRVLLLQIWAGLTCAQVAHAMGLPSTGAMKTMRHRALGSLRTTDLMEVAA